jgi:hypothetical protein
MFHGVTLVRTILSFHLIARSGAIRVFGALVTHLFDALGLRISLLVMIGRSVRNPAQQKNREHNSKELKHEFFLLFLRASLKRDTLACTCGLVIKFQAIEVSPDHDAMFASSQPPGWIRRFPAQPTKKYEGCGIGNAAFMPA